MGRTWFHGQLGVEKSACYDEDRDNYVIKTEFEDDNSFTKT